MCAPLSLAKRRAECSRTGLTPAAKAFWIAGSASDDARNEFVLAVVPTDRDVEQVASDIRFFLGGLEGLSADELENAVLPFPSQEVDPYRGLAPHLRIASARARALHAMATGQARVVVASAAALAPRVSPPDAIVALALDLKPETTSTRGGSPRRSWTRDSRTRTPWTITANSASAAA